MSRKISKANKEVIKKQILDSLIGYASTYQVSKNIGRSWTFTIALLKELADENKLEWIEVGELMAWRIKQNGE